MYLNRKQLFKILIIFQMLLFLPRMHLFGKNSKIWNIITILNNCFFTKKKYIFFCKTFLKICKKKKKKKKHFPQIVEW